MLRSNDRGFWSRNVEIIYLEIFVRLCQFLLTLIRGRFANTLRRLLVDKTCDADHLAQAPRGTGQRGRHPVYRLSKAILSTQPKCLSQAQRHRTHVLRHKRLAAYCNSIRPARQELFIRHHTRRNCLFLAQVSESAT